jgi:meso-butanediol dehydrogenase/(S,S)-butanediol dehydrogenase/diacetyl reductase
MSGRLEGRRIIVTGGARGIGAAFARALAAEGAAVVVGDIDEDAARATAESIAATGRRASAVGVDVSDPDSVAALFTRADEEFGGLDVLFNNAGLLRQQAFLDITEADWHLLHDVNVRGVLLCTQQAARRFLAAGSGKIVNTCSTSSRQPSADYAAYATTKAAVLSLTQSSARALAPHGITVNGIGPGIVDTELWNSARSAGQARPLADYAAQIPLGRPARPEDIAPTAVFLASRDSDYITGQLLMVDGGMVIQ